MGETTLTIEQLASHKHTAMTAVPQDQVNGSYLTDGPGNYLNARGAATLTTGSSQPHTHSLSGASSEAANSLPPYYAGHYVIRV